MKKKKFLREEIWEKRNYLLNCWTMKWNAVRKLLSFLTKRLDFASMRRQLDLYRKKEHLNVQVDFQDFFYSIQEKKNERKHRQQSRKTKVVFLSYEAASLFLWFE